MLVVDVPGTGGRRKQVRRRGFATKKEAQEELTRLRSDLQRGTFIARTRMTVDDYLTAWLHGLPSAGRRPSTISSYRLLLRRSVLPTIGHIELQALRAVDLDVLYSQLLERGLAASTVRKAHVVLGKAFSDAARKELLVRNPARFATPPSASAARAPEMRHWTPAELGTFLSEIRAHHQYPVIRTAAMTGLRRGELCGLRWTDVDLDGGTLSVRRTIASVDGKLVHGDVKTARSRRVIDVDPTTVATLRAWRRTQLEDRLLVGSAWIDTGLVFTMPNGEGWHPKSISQAFDRLVRASVAKALQPPVPRIRFHDLRHTHASQLLAAGVNVKVVSERLGHSSVAFTLDTYAHVMPGQQAHAAAAVAALVDLL
jgi:integrase